MTVHSGCAARMGLVVHIPDRILAGDKCGVCDPDYRPWSDLVARDFGKREKCCTTKRCGADLPDPTSTTAERGKSKHAPHSAPLADPPSLEDQTINRKIMVLIGIGLTSRAVAERLNITSAAAVRKRLERIRQSQARG